VSSRNISYLSPKLFPHLKHFHFINKREATVILSHMFFILTFCVFHKYNLF